MKQHCLLVNVWLAWLGLPALAMVVGYLRGWLFGVLVLVVGVVAQVVYIRVFPFISRWIGYGSVVDEEPQSMPEAAAVGPVTLYTARVCPFCPIVRQRLLELQHELDFEYRELDVTFRQQLVQAHGFRSVPVVEVEGRFLTGNATSAQLAAFLVGQGANETTA